jgi:hypothetical protein
LLTGKEAAKPHIARRPPDPGKQLARVAFDASSELYEGVDPGYPKAALKLADLRSMDRCSDAQLVLGHARLLASTDEVVAELARYVHQASSRAAK